LPRTPEYVLVPGAGHYAYLAPCPESLLVRTPLLCTDPPGIDRASFHLQLGAEIAEFFRHALVVP